MIRLFHKRPPSFEFSGSGPLFSRVKRIEVTSVSEVPDPLKDYAFHLKDVACDSWACGRLGLAAGFCSATCWFWAGFWRGPGREQLRSRANCAPQAGPGCTRSRRYRTGAASRLGSRIESKPAKPEKPLEPCDIKNSGASMVATGGLRAVSVLGVGETTRTAGASAVQSKVCSRFMAINWYDRFVTGPDVMRFSPEQKLRLALTNIINPFNLGTIVGEAGISVAANSHSPYGPGVDGWAKLSGTNLTQDMTDQFFGTFLIPSITHTDPHYHRRPDLSIPRRILPLRRPDRLAARRQRWPRLLNYSQIVAPVFDIGISNLYVPGLQTHFSADAERYGIDIATAPIDNFITEFVPSIASHIHTHAVFVQRIINHVAVNPP